VKSVTLWEREFSLRCILLGTYCTKNFVNFRRSEHVISDTKWQSCGTAETSTFLNVNFEQVIADRQTDILHFVFCIAGPQEINSCNQSLPPAICLTTHTHTLMSAWGRNVFQHRVFFSLSLSSLLSFAKRVSFIYTNFFTLYNPDLIYIML
jgi:hypothetical protein